MCTYETNPLTNEFPVASANKPDCLLLSGINHHEGLQVFYYTERRHLMMFNLYMSMYNEYAYTTVLDLDY